VDGSVSVGASALVWVAGPLEVRQRQKSTPSLLVLCCCLLVLKARSTECAKRTTTAADTAAPHTHPPGQGGGGGNLRGEAPRKCHLNSSSNRRYVDNTRFSWASAPLAWVCSDLCSTSYISHHHHRQQHLKTAKASLTSASCHKYAMNFALHAPSRAGQCSGQPPDKAAAFAFSRCSCSPVHRPLSTFGPV